MGDGSVSSNDSRLVSPMNLNDCCIICLARGLEANDFIIDVNHDFSSANFQNVSNYFTLTFARKKSDFCGDFFTQPDHEV